MTFILPRWGTMALVLFILTVLPSLLVSLNHKTMLIFINSCGETGERPAIRVMITINETWVTAQVTNDVVKKINIEVYYSDDSDSDNINIYNILFAIIKPKIDGIKANATLDVIHGLNRFVADNGPRVNAYIDVITAATDRAKEEGLNLVEYLIRYANKD